MSVLQTHCSLISVMVHPPPQQIRRNSQAASAKILFLKILLPSQISDHDKKDSFNLVNYNSIKIVKTYKDQVLGHPHSKQLVRMAKSHWWDRKKMKDGNKFYHKKECLEPKQLIPLGYSSSTGSRTLSYIGNANVIGGATFTELPRLSLKF